MKSGVMNRNIIKKECDWLSAPFLKGDKVYEYEGHTFGCISPSGIAVTRNIGQTPFSEVPIDSVDWIES